MNNTKQYVKLFELLCLQFHGAKLGKKVSQKMFYFFERKGMPLNLRYGIHYYGPYSAKLDNIMHILESDDYIKIDTSGTTHIISIGSEHLEAKVLTEDQEKIAEEVITAFELKSPLELEALATMDYVANFILPNGATESDVIEKFKEIKGRKFNEDIIRTSLKELKQLKFMA